MQRSAKDESNVGDRAAMESSAFAIYFTRAQGEKLAQLFRQEYLLEKIGPNMGQTSPALIEPEGDAY
jgi:hypothetical protein